MSFAINPSLNHIDIPESCVYELYRSATEVLLQDARFRGHPCEAFICIAKIEKKVKAYVALLETGMKTVFVYTSDHSASEPAEYPQVYAQAEAFVQAMGFVMEPVNLGFSPAMREVIIKGFRVMRPPPPKKQYLRQTKTDSAADLHTVDLDAALSIAMAEDLSAVQSFPDAELESLQRELASAKAAIAQTTREKVLLEQKAALEISSLKAACEQAVAAKQKAAEKFAAEMEKIRLEERSRVSRVDDEEITALRAGTKTAAAAAKTAESRLQQQVASLQQRAKQLESDNHALEQKLAAAAAANAEQIKLLAEERDSLLARIAADESAALAAADKIAELERFETSWREGQQREEDLCRDLDLLKSEIEKLKEISAREEELQLRVNGLELELQQYHETVSRNEELQLSLNSREAELQQYQEKESREESLQLQVHSLQQELVAAKSELERVGGLTAVSETAAAEMQQLRAEKQAVEAEYVRLANESREKELEMHDAITAAEMENERLARELEIQVQVAAMEQAALRAELRKMVVSGATIVTAVAPVMAATGETAAVAISPAEVPVATRRAAAAAVVVEQLPAAAPPAAKTAVQSAAKQAELTVLQEEDAEPDRPIASDTAVISGLMNEFGSFGWSSGHGATEFKIDPGMSAVAYSDPAEIEVLLYSSNTVQAVPDGSSIQRCKGYVIATKKEGIYSVYVAWYLTESKSVVVCTPQQQPADSEECVRILQDAVAYFEIVGFMMEVEELGESVRSYNRALRKVPVLSRAG